jgi:hypothetical protein
MSLADPKEVTMTIPLEAMVRDASRMAEQMFDEDGAIDMFWLIDTPAGIIGALSPVIAETSTEASQRKDAIVEAMRDLLREHDATRYVRVAEAWTVDGVPTLDLLADDEVVSMFATDVPGSSIQVVGGRRSRDGKLFVSGVAKAGPGGFEKAFEEADKKIVKAESKGIEFVTGPEAEDLISRVQAEMEWQARGSDNLTDHPLRKEKVVITASDGRELLMATRDVVRPPGGKPYLSELSTIVRPDRARGRLAADLLPSAAAAARQ